MRLLFTLFPLTTGILFAQPAAPPPSFEVASIRVSQLPQTFKEGARREGVQVSPDTLTMHNVSLRSAIRWAYHVMDYQVTGPDWIGGNGQRFDIVAKAAGSADEDQLRLMLQTLLADRFKLVLHRVNKEMSGYVLSVGKNGPKFHESQTQGESRMDPDVKTMTVVVQRTPMSRLVELLTNILHAPVIDQTGLTGKYDITINAMKYAADMSKRGDGEAPPDPYAIIMGALQDELGLKIEARKMPVDLLIVDHVEKLPTEN